jgi:tetratricopeptide (TPR) repeat protein
LFAGDIDAAIATSEKVLEMAEAEENHSAMGGFLEYMGDIMMKTGNAAGAIEYYDQALEHRQMANINDANKRQAGRAHMFKTAIAAMIDGESEVAAERTANYIAAAEEEGTAFERRRIHEVAAFLAMNQSDYETAAAEFDQASQLNPIVLYWSAVVNKELGNMEKAADLAARAAHRNTLSGNLPFFRNEAVALQEELAAM